MLIVALLRDKTQLSRRLDTPQCVRWRTRSEPPGAGGGAWGAAPQKVGHSPIVTSTMKLEAIPFYAVGLAVVFGELSYRQHKRGVRGGATFAFSLTGRITGWVGIIIGLVGVALIVVVFLNA